MSVPGWLTRIPIAHRGLHDHEHNIVENSITAFERAISKGFTIETDLQCTGDNEPVVFHDPVLGRLLDAEGSLRDLTVKEFKALSYKDSGDPMLDLQGFLDLVAGQVPLLIEIKSLGDFNPAFAGRVIEIMRTYQGKFALMSFDPRMVGAVREELPDCVRGLVSAGFDSSDWPGLDAFTRFKLRHLYYAWHTRPHFIAYSINALPALAPLIMKAIGKPLLAWTVNTPERLAKARHLADNIIFENIAPDA